MPTLDYCTVSVVDLERATRFYDALLGSIGWAPVMVFPDRGRIYGDGTSMLGVMTPYDGREGMAGNGSMFGIRFDNPDALAAFHAKALELGAGNEGDPGERMPGAHMGYFRDPEGNKICGYVLAVPN